MYSFLSVVNLTNCKHVWQTMLKYNRHLSSFQKLWQPGENCTVEHLYHLHFFTTCHCKIYLDISTHKITRTKFWMPTWTKLFINCFANFPRYFFHFNQWCQHKSPTNFRIRNFQMDYGTSLEEWSQMIL